jgi:hypothetical protein
MRTSRILVMLALSLLVSVAALAECKPRPLDLAGGDTTLQDSALAGQELCFELLNSLPDAEYEREIRKEIEVIPPLPLPDSKVKTTQEMAAKSVSLFQCNVQDVKDAISALSEAKQEKDIPKHRATLQRLRQTQTLPNCVRAINSALGTIGPRSVPNVPSLDRGERLTVTVTRKKDDQSNPPRWGEKTWKFVFTTGPRGEWNASYGFAFLPERNEEFFAKEQDDGTFVVTRQSESSDLDVEPAVFFTWTSAKRQGKAWTWGPTAGLGFDLSEPTVFAGYSWTYNRNITFIAGAGVHQRSRLDGTFEEGQVLEQTLTPDQLEDDEGFGVSGFVGVTLRFGKNPFKGGGDDSKDKGNGDTGGGSQ